MMKQCKKIPTSAILIFAMAAILRIASLGKYVYMDEYPIFANVINFFFSDTLMPVNFCYPTLFSYLAAIPIAMGAGILYVCGTLASPSDIAILLSFDRVLPILPARLVSVVFGLATVFLLFKIGERFFDRRTGLIAAAFLAVSKLHIHYSSYALPDVTMTFLATVSLMFSLSALRTKSTRDLIFAGVFAGFTASTKYNGALIILPIISVYLIWLYDEKKLLSVGGWINKRSILCGLAFGGAFFIGSPGWLYKPGLFGEAFIFEHNHMAIGHLGFFGTPYIKHLILSWDWEKTAAIFWGLGIIYAIFRRSRQDIVLLILILPSFLYIGSWQKKNLYYLLFLYPALALLSARLLSEIFQKLNNKPARGWTNHGKNPRQAWFYHKNHHVIANIASCRPVGQWWRLTLRYNGLYNFLYSKKAAKAVPFLILIFAFAWPIYSASTFAYQQTLEDSRWVAYRFIQANIPEGSKIAIDWGYLPKFLTDKQKKSSLKHHRQEMYSNLLSNIRTHELIPLNYSPIWLANVKTNYLITSSYCFDRFFNTPPPPSDNPLFNDHNNRKAFYTALLYQGKEAGWKLLKEFYTQKGPCILIYERILE